MVWWVWGILLEVEFKLVLIWVLLWVLGVCIMVIEVVVFLKLVVSWPEGMLMWWLVM